MKQCYACSLVFALMGILQGKIFVFHFACVIIPNPVSGIMWKTTVNQYHLVKLKILPVQRQEARITFDSIMEVGAFSYSVGRLTGEKVHGGTF